MAEPTKTYGRNRLALERARRAVQSARTGEHRRKAWIKEGFFFGGEFQPLRAQLEKLLAAACIPRVFRVDAPRPALQTARSLADLAF